MSCSPAGGAGSSTCRELKCTEDIQNAPAEWLDAIMLLADWMLADVAALADSFRINPNELFKEAVHIFAAAIETNDLFEEPSPPEKVGP